MKFKSGKHAGMTTEEILLKKPDVAEWYIKNREKSRYAKDFKRLIEIFDRIPLVCPCNELVCPGSEDECGRRATGAYGKVEYGLCSGATDAVHTATTKARQQSVGR